MVDEKDKVDMINQDKFVWNESDIQIADSLCDFCLYNDKENCNKCSQYLEGKPADIINDSCNCKKFIRKGRIIL